MLEEPPLRPSWGSQALRDLLKEVESKDGPVWRQESWAIVCAATDVDIQMHEVDGQDIGRVHACPCAHPVRARVTTLDFKGQHHKADRLSVRQHPRDD